MKKLILTTIFLCFSLVSRSSHFFGGEITWECNKDPISVDYGKYTFHLTLYQDCSNGIDFSTISQNLTVHNHPSLFSINVPFSSVTDISASGIASSFACYNCDNQPFGQFGAIKQFTYSSEPIIITGFPPSNGWHFTWGNCCRASYLANGMNDDDFTLRAVMYAYTDSNAVVYPNNNMCFDNSPVFKEKPKSIKCTGIPEIISYNAMDSDFDSLTYSWEAPLGDEFAYNPANASGTALAFTPPYSVNSQIPGNPILNNEDGKISFLSNTTGVFVTCVKVAAFKCGQVVAEVFRDVAIGITSCGTLPNGLLNSPPIISSPIGPQNWFANINPATGLPTYETTITAGDLVSFSISATDNDINLTGNIQDVFLQMEGNQINSPFAISNLANFSIISSSPGIISGEFLWQSTCDHLQNINCDFNQVEYVFTLRAYDDFCPSNGTAYAIIKIKLVSPVSNLSITSPSTICSNESSFSLSAIPPSGLSQQGFGVFTDSLNSAITLFDPILYGPGLHNITYTYTPNGCNPISITSPVVVYESPIVSVSGGGTICADGSTTDISFNYTGNLPWDLTFSRDSFLYPSVSSIFSNNYSFNTFDSGSYSITNVTDINNCVANIDTLSVVVVVNPLPLPIIYPSEAAINFGEDIVLSVDNYINYQWYNESDDLIGNDQFVVISDSGSFYILVEDENGCVGISQSSLISILNPVLNIPSLFTPNSDGIHDDWQIDGIEAYPNVNIKIFNRWGQLLFDSNGYGVRWDGKYNGEELPIATYYYIINLNNGLKAIQGTVNIKR